MYTRDVKLSFPNNNKKNSRFEFLPSMLQFWPVFRRMTHMASNELTLSTDAWLYVVHRTCTETAAVSCDSAVNTPLRWIFKGRCRKSLSRNHTRQERRESRVMYLLHWPFSSEVWNLRYTRWEQRTFETCVTRDENRESLKPALHEMRTDGDISLASSLKSFPSRSGRSLHNRQTVPASPSISISCIVWALD